MKTKRIRQSNEGIIVKSWFDQLDKMEKDYQELRKKSLDLNNKRRFKDKSAANRLLKEIEQMKLRKRAQNG